MKLLTYIIGLFLGVFVGGYLCLYGGAMQIFNAVQCDLSVQYVIIGGLRILFAPLGFVVPFMLCGTIALGMKSNKWGW